MSLYGYKPKTKQAPWVTAFPHHRQGPGSRTIARKVPKPPSYLSKTSERQRAKNAQYRPIAVAFLARPENKVCAVCLKPATPGNPLHVHHVRGRDGKLQCDNRFFMAVHDYDCHPWIHANPNDARELGLLAMPGQWGKQEP